MCGRSRCSLAPEEVAARTGVPAERWRDRQAYRPSYNVSPGFATPVIVRGEDGRRCLHTMKWVARLSAVCCAESLLCVR